MKMKNKKNKKPILLTKLQIPITAEHNTNIHKISYNMGSQTITSSVDQTDQCSIFSSDDDR